MFGPKETSLSRQSTFLRSLIFALMAKKAAKTEKGKAIQKPTQVMKKPAQVMKKPAQVMKKPAILGRLWTGNDWLEVTEAYLDPESNSVFGVLEKDGKRKGSFNVRHLTACIPGSQDGKAIRMSYCQRKERGYFQFAKGEGGVVARGVICKA